VGTQAWSDPRISLECDHKVSIVVMGHNVGCKETIHGNILVGDISKWTEKWGEMCGFIGEV